MLEVAQRLIQVRGFNGFSYADIAGELGITKASLHYHFRSKAELGLALIVRYGAGFAGALDIIDETAADARAKPGAYAEIYSQVLRGGACACAQCSPPNTRPCPRPS